MALSGDLCRKSGGSIGWFNGVHFVNQNGAQLFFFGALLPSALSEYGTYCVDRNDYF